MRKPANPYLLSAALFPAAAFLVASCHELATPSPVPSTAAPHASAKISAPAAPLLPTQAAAPTVEPPPAPAPAPSMFARRDALAHEFLDFDTARQVLIELARTSGDPRLEAGATALSLPPRRTSWELTVITYYCGPWTIDPYNKRWSATFDDAPTTSEFRNGFFYRDASGQWASTPPAGGTETRFRLVGGRLVK